MAGNRAQKDARKQGLSISRFEKNCIKIINSFNIGFSERGRTLMENPSVACKPTSSGPTGFNKGRLIVHRLSTVVRENVDDKLRCLEPCLKIDTLGAIVSNDSVVVTQQKHRRPEILHQKALNERQ